MPKYFKRETPDLRGTGKTSYHYELRSLGALDTSDVARAMHHRMRLLSEGDYIAVAHEMVDVIATLLADGYTVTLDGLGCFSVSLGLADYNANTADTHQSLLRRVALSAQNK